MRKEGRGREGRRRERRGSEGRGAKEGGEKEGAEWRGRKGRGEKERERRKGERRKGERSASRERKMEEACRLELDDIKAHPVFPSDQPTPPPHFQPRPTVPQSIRQFITDSIPSFTPCQQLI